LPCSGLFNLLPETYLRYGEISANWCNQDPLERTVQGLTDVINRPRRAL